MQKKAAILVGGAVVLLASASWAGISFYKAIANETTPDASGAALHIDVVAPKEPDIVQSSDKLSVGHLNDGYDHAETMARTAPVEDNDDYTSWDDGAWAAENGTGPVESKRTTRSDDVAIDLDQLY